MAVANDDKKEIPDYYALALPCNRAAELVFTALQILGGDPAAAADHLRLALALLAPGAGDLIPKAPPLLAAPATTAFARPGYRAAALVFTALQILGEYPEGAPDYDATAVGHLRLALELLAPGLGNLKVLGAPQPAKPPPPPPIDDEAPPAAPAWVEEVLAEAAGGSQAAGDLAQDAEATTASPRRLSQSQLAELAALQLVGLANYLESTLLTDEDVTHDRDVVGALVRDARALAGDPALVGTTSLQAERKAALQQDLGDLRRALEYLAQLDPTDPQRNELRAAQVALGSLAGTLRGLGLVASAEAPAPDAAPQAPAPSAGGTTS